MYTRIKIHTNMIDFISFSKVLDKVIKTGVGFKEFKFRSNLSPSYFIEMKTGSLKNDIFETISFSNLLSIDFSDGNEYVGSISFDCEDLDVHLNDDDRIEITDDSVAILFLSLDHRISEFFDTLDSFEKHKKEVVKYWEGFDVAMVITFKRSLLAGAIGNAIVEVLPRTKRKK